MVFDHDYDKYPELTQTQIEQFQFTSPHPQITEDFEATVVKVHDGDTVTLRTDFRDFDFPLRLLDVDAPELSEGGDEAKEWLTSRILNKKVEIKIDIFRRVGKYGRLLGKIISNGLDVAEEMEMVGLVQPFERKKESEIPQLGKIMREVAI